MSDAQKKPYDAEIGDVGELWCLKCNQRLTVRPVTLSYLNSAFPVELPACPKCGMVYIPEQLALGKILHVEQSLEDK